jgi:hypothetical protein
MTTNALSQQSAPAFGVTGLTGATTATRHVGGTTSGAPVSGTFSTGDTETDLAGNVWICTSGGSPGNWIAAGASAFNPQSLLWDASCVASTAPNPFVYQATTFTPTSGVLCATALIIPAGYPVNDITFWTSAAAAVTVSHGWYVILNSAGTVVAVTADQTTGSPWGAVKKAYKFATTATWTPSATALYYLGIMIAASTMPSTVVVGSAFSNALNTNGPSGAPILYGSATTTGLTTPPSVGASYTITASGTAPLLAQVSSS